jgi:hypothetical protein
MKRISEKTRVPRTKKICKPTKREVMKAQFAFVSEGINYYSVYFTDKSSEVLTTSEMMERFPKLLIRTLEERI